jgi:hypothetical protein
LINDIVDLFPISYIPDSERMLAESCLSFAGGDKNHTGNQKNCQNKNETGAAAHPGCPFIVRELSTRRPISTPFEIICKVSPFDFAINPPLRSDDITGKLMGLSPLKHHVGGRSVFISASALSPELLILSAEDYGIDPGPT